MHAVGFQVEFIARIMVKGEVVFLLSSCACFSYATFQIESKLDLEQVWKLKKEGASRKSIQTLLTDSPAYKRKADDSDMPAPAAKKQKVTKKRANKETSKEKQQKNGKKKQGSIFDHFKPATVEENGESKPKYAQKLIDMIELAKSLVPNRSTR